MLVCVSNDILCLYVIIFIGHKTISTGFKGGTERQEQYPA